MVIRSFRRVFDLERRIYRLDALRLNPGGVPVRVLVYFLALLLGFVLVARLPVLGEALSLAPWYLRDLALPAICAAGLAALRVDGRPGHLAAYAIARIWLQPRHLVGGRPRPRPPERWWPPDFVLLPDGAEGCLRRMRYDGPGQAMIAVAHRRVAATRPHVAAPARAVIAVSATTAARRPRALRVIVLPLGGRLELARGADARVR
jgi:hypothetical protein